jgi:enoyl-CoA hydratase/carnithine racemase
MSESLVLFEVCDGVARVTLNHPEKRNALSLVMLTTLGDVIGQCANDRTVRIVIIKAVGTAFSAGHDLRELANATPRDTAELFGLCTQVMEAIRRLAKPVIAQVQGVATAAGCQLVASCDLVVASESATFATPGVKIGLFCSTPAVALCRAVAPKHALEMLFTGAAISAWEAHRIGLVNRVVPVDRLEEETLTLARQIITTSEATLALGKRVFYEQLSMDYPEAYGVAQQAMVVNAGTPDAREGIAAFLEKRAPRWSD